MTLRCSGNNEVSKTRCMALTSRSVRDGTGDPRGRRVESKNAVTIKMQYGFQPRRQVRTLAYRSLTPRFGDSIFDFRYRYYGQEQ